MNKPSETTDHKANNESLTDDRKAARQKEKNSRRRRVYQSFSAAPYLRSRVTTGDLMYLVVLALLPCAGVGIYHYGFHAALLLGISVLSAILAELVCDLVKNRGSSRRLSSAAGTAASGSSAAGTAASGTGRQAAGSGRGNRALGASVLDYSCVVTGLIGGLILPPAAPYWTAVALPVMAIVVFKHLFGGLGRNLFNPAMAAKCVLLFAARSAMLNVSTWEYTESSPLTLLAGGETPSLLSEITGAVPGYIGTSSAAAVVCAAVILYVAGVIDLAIPVSAIAAFSVCYILIGRYGLSAYTLGVQLCGGSFLFTVFIMAEDFTTTPISKRARVLYGILLGALIFVFRRIGFWEDGCVYALLAVNALRPLLDRRLPQAYFGVNSNKWVIKETASRRKAREEKEKLLDERTNEQMDAEFAAFEEKIERETRGLETARYTGDDTLLREAMADVPEGTLRGRGNAEPRNHETQRYGDPGVYGPSPEHGQNGITNGYAVPGDQAEGGSSAPGNRSGSKRSERGRAADRNRGKEDSRMSEHEKRVSRQRAKRKEEKFREESSRDLSLEEARKMIQDAVAREQYMDSREMEDLQVTHFTNEPRGSRSGKKEPSSKNPSDR